MSSGARATIAGCNFQRTPQNATGKKSASVGAPRCVPARGMQSNREKPPPTHVPGVPKKHAVSKNPPEENGDRNGNGPAEKGHRGHKVGLLPTGGWSRRNYHFVRRILLPQIFSLRTGTPLRPDLLTHEGGGFQVTWIGHASFLIQTEGMNVLVDPVWSRWLGLLKRVRMPG